MPMSPRQSRSPSPSIHYKKLPFRVASFPRPGSNVPTLPAGLSAAQGAPTPKKYWVAGAPNAGGNHYDTPAIRGIFDSRILLVALSTEGPVMTGLNAEVSAPPVAADQHSFSPSVGGLLINIDKGGTLTDFCVIDGENVYRTKLVALWRFHPHQCARGCHIYGPSDSTLNCQGVRIGTTEIYRAVEKIPEVAVSLIVRGELPGGNFFIPLFLVLKNLAQLDEDIQLEITTKLPQYCTPGHVRDRMYRFRLLRVSDDRRVLSDER
jgi:hypothetical protein